MSTFNYQTDEILNPGKYQTNKLIPVVQTPYPEDPIKAISKIKTILPGMTFEITGNVVENLKSKYKKFDKNGNPTGNWLYADAQRRWYKVRTNLFSGYVNELAFLGKMIKQL